MNRIIAAGGMIVVGAVSALVFVLVTVILLLIAFSFVEFGAGWLTYVVIAASVLIGWLASDRTYRLGRSWVRRDYES